MDKSLVEEVEMILRYRFKNKNLLEEALTHSSFTQSVSYERLEFIGDSLLSVAITNHIFILYPFFAPAQLSILRAANNSTEKLARAAIAHRLHRYIRHNSRPLVDQVEHFVDTINKELHPVLHPSSMKAPKVLADIIESIIAALYFDLNFDLHTTWMIIKPILEPMVTADDLEQQPEPVTALFERCKKKGMQIDIKQWRNREVNIANVFIEGQFVASASSPHKCLAKMKASKIALHKLGFSIPSKIKSLTNIINLSFYTNGDATSLVVNAKRRLHQLCHIKRWPKPDYMIEKNSGLAHERRYVRAVRISTEDGILQMSGYEKSRVTDAENSAASLMLLALQDQNGAESDFAFEESMTSLRNRIHVLDYCISFPLKGTLKIYFGFGLLRITLCFMIIRRYA